MDAVKAHIEHDPMTDAVKVWLYRPDQGGTVYMWPMQEVVSDLVERPVHIRPALEMARFMWEAFIQALRETDHQQPAGALLYKALEREQNRVDALIHALIDQSRPVALPASEGNYCV